MFCDFKKGLPLLVAAMVGGTATADVTFSVTDLYTSKNNAPYSPLIGETYSITAKWKMMGGPAKQSYQIVFRMANRDKYVEITDLNKTEWTSTADFGVLPLDGPIPIEFEVDPFGFANGADKTKSKIPLDLPDPLGGGSPRPRAIIAINPDHLQVVGLKKKKSTFTPRTPTNAVQYYDSKYALGAMSQFFDFKAGGSISRMALMMGSPTTDSWQKSMYTYARVDSGLGSHTVNKIPVENVSAYPVHFWDKSNVPKQQVGFIQQYVLELRNVRVNMPKLQAVTWSQIDALKGINIFKFYTQPEDVIQSNHATVKQFVTNTLGSNYRSKYKPYDAARKLFNAVLKHCTYYYPPPNGPDLRAHNAVDLINGRKGDCGSFSLLLVALYRNIGIPARTACGAWMGQDAGHCWSEMWIPGGGWILSDGSAGNGMDEYGDYAYYFGNMPDLNVRFAMMRGNTFNVKEVKTSWLQGPVYPYVWGTAQIDDYEAHSALIEITKSQAEGFGGDSFGGTAEAKMTSIDSILKSKPKVRAASTVRCPCHKHGGYPLFLRKREAPKIKVSGRGGA